MSQTDKRKIEWILPRAEMGTFLRQMGEGMEAGVISIGDTEVALENFKNLGVEMESVGDKVRVKLKVKFFTSGVKLRGVDASEGDSGVVKKKMKYKTLKKIMGSQFKAIRRALEVGQMPETGLIHDFVRNSELMITYPDQGDEYYPEYRKATEDFMAAATEGNVEALYEVYKEMYRQMKVCHDRYK